MTSLKVKIKNNLKNPDAWYSKYPGENFEVYDLGKDYIAKEDFDLEYFNMWRHIHKQDCEEISDIIKRPGSFQVQPNIIINVTGM